MDDVIYRKDAAKILCNWCGVCPEDKRDIMNCDDICPEFAKIPSAQQWIPPRRCIDCENFNKTQLLVPQAQQKQWIPCSERLPEEDGDYLVCYEEGYRKDYGFPKIGIAPFEVDIEHFGVWTEDFDLVSLGSLGTEFVEIDVVAWMPLPEPYKGEDGG